MIDGWDPPTVLDAMVEEQIAAGSGSTYFFTSLLDCPGFGPEHVELMHFIGLGGSPIPDAVAERADELGISLVRSYGCTEHPSVTGSEHEAPREKRIHTDGRPLDWVEVRTVDEDGKDVGVGEPGEILSRGPDRFAGYTDPALTAEAIDEEGWFRTGDVGVIDADGYLTITDRVKDIIIRGGENVSAAEVEQLLAHMEGVAEVAVVAAPDERLGEHGCAFFRMQPGLRGARSRRGAGPPGRSRAGPAEVAGGAARRRGAAAHAVGQGAEVRPARATARRRVARRRAAAVARGYARRREAHWRTRERVQTCTIGSPGSTSIFSVPCPSSRPARNPSSAPSPGWARPSRWMRTPTSRHGVSRGVSSSSSSTASRRAGSARGR